MRSPEFVEMSSLPCPSCGGASAYWLDFESNMEEGAPVSRVCAPEQKDNGFIELDIMCHDQQVTLVPWSKVKIGIKFPDQEICSAADLDQMEESQ